jgi:hypothetical protein
MSEPIKISTSKYTKQGQVDVDGNIWNVVLPGAGTELRFSQASRACKMNAARIGLLDKKIDNGSITSDELDKYEEYSKAYESNESIVYQIFQNTFRDSTDDNSEVKKWINDTPTSIIMLAFEDVKSQANGEANGQKADQQSA